MTQPDDTIFDKIIRGEIPATFVYRDDHVVAFNDINPVAPVHVLVVPLKKIESLRSAQDMGTEELGAFFAGVSRCAKSLGLDDAGYRVVLNNGPHAQQSVPYIHAHVIGGKPLGWPPC